MNELLNNLNLFIVVFITVLIMTYLVTSFFKEQIDSSLKYKRFEQKRVYRAERKKRLGEALTEKDKSIFYEFLTILPFNSGTIEFLKYHNMEESFHGSKLDDLYKFYYDWNTKKHKFPNRSLEEEQNKLYTLVGEYIQIATKTLKNSDLGYLKATKNIDILNSKSNDIIESYKKFIESTEEKLLVLTKSPYPNAIHNSPASNIKNQSLQSSL